MNHAERENGLAAGSCAVQLEKNGWTCCGIPVNRGNMQDFWTLWAKSRDSRKCRCGEMVVTGPCPVCGEEYMPGFRG